MMSVCVYVGQEEKTDMGKEKEKREESWGK